MTSRSNNNNGAAAAAAGTSHAAPRLATATGNRRVKASARRGRRVFAFGSASASFRIWHTRLADALLDVVQTFFESIVLLLGPLLITLALAIASLLSYSFFYLILPMMQEKHAHEPLWYQRTYLGLHIAWVLCLLVNALFHYYMCVTTRNSGPHHAQVVQELAAATNFDLPQTPAAIETYRRDYEDKMVLRIQRRRDRELEKQQKEQQQNQPDQQPQQESGNDNDEESNNHHANSNEASSPAAGNQNVTQRKTQRNGGSTKTSNSSKPPLNTANVRRWMLMGPFEWGYCQNSKQPKPPRSHYDHVTKRLVLNLDHYCPWMFNSIGYFNYRYFVSFLIWVFVGMVYGACLSLEPFLLLQSPEYLQLSRQERAANQHRPHGQPSIHMTRPLPMIPHRDEKMWVSLSFMLCAAIACAVLILGGFHIFLVLTAQTTIEFHGNWNKWRRNRHAYTNPYSEGSWYKNWQRVFGSSRHWLLAVAVPSTRSPEYLPVPIPGQDTRRRHVLAAGLAKKDEPELTLNGDNVV